MDGLSGAASVIGVVSLTIQLVETVKQARELFNDARDASSEVQRLHAALLNIQTMLETMQEALRLQEGRLLPCSFISSVRTALESCKHTLAPLESFLQESTNRIHDKSRRWQYTTAKLRVAVKKKDVTQMESKLQMAMMVLQTAMICNITELGYVQHKSCPQHGPTYIDCARKRRSTPTNFPQELSQRGIEHPHAQPQHITFAQHSRDHRARKEVRLVLATIFGCL
jgi:heme exporter protein D